MTGIILAGGESRRMGREKSLLDFKGRPLVAHMLELCAGLFEQTVIVTNKPDHYRSYGAELVSDVFDIRGPLTGIYSGLLKSRSEYSFVAACDMPFLNPRLIAYMGAAAQGYDAVVPRYQGYLEPLHAVYHRGLLPAIESRLRKGDRRIRSMFDDLAVRYLAEEEIDRFDPLRRSFRNLNTPEEYKEAVCSDWECRNSSLS
jgi:molybdopterin-guanine dinucleotide biosynthesis protein A